MVSITLIPFHYMVVSVTYSNCDAIKMNHIISIER